jgi:hypothetical protein
MVYSSPPTCLSSKVSLESRRSQNDKSKGKTQKQNGEKETETCERPWGRVAVRALATVATRS